MTSKPDNREVWPYGDEWAHKSEDGYGRFFLTIRTDEEPGFYMLGPVREWLADQLIADHNQAQLVERLRAALEALAKVQYDGTVEGLRHQIDTEDWGEVLDVKGTREAYELTLDVLAELREGGA